ncbi:GTPase of the mitochondrial inner membrane that associates with the large ribosomal subunit [Paramarasmius palmivorus]|uniref:GTPase of the mitochondrial inner membrane that associates with the large ribosomal subunit n=1 Tax=Paramarasmius palmivorus TaxID=297713 RepID=A0AAW0AYA3_9AGAR
MFRLKPPCPYHSLKRYYSTVPDTQQSYLRRLRTSHKRLQSPHSQPAFLDHLIITIRGGSGGDGCAAFHREKFLPFGPPSGGNGGRGGDIYVLPSTHVTSLAGIPKKLVGEKGSNGQGTWQNGKNGQPVVLRVPVGTIVRELGPEDTRRAKDEWEAEEEALEGLEGEEREEKMRERRWVHYPRYAEANVERDTFKDAEKALYREERERKWARKRRAPVYLDLDTAPDESVDEDAPLGLPRTNNLGHLVARGGAGGLGNPHFASSVNRSPKFATRGQPGERITLELELKLLADIGLVGVPNAGKSTLVRALTGGRSRTTVAGYEFTTLNPVVGVVRVSEDGTLMGGEPGVIEETRVEEEKEKQRIRDGEYAPTQRYNTNLKEAYRFTISDNPGLIHQSSANVGLGHSFLRAIERSLALVYVVDFSEPAPWEQLGVLKEELEAYKEGMSGKARMVVANKADLQGEEEGKEKLRKLEEYVKEQLGEGIDVVPVSAKYSLNLKRVVGLMKGYVESAAS